MLHPTVVQFGTIIHTHGVVCNQVGGVEKLTWLRYAGDTLGDAKRAVGGDSLAIGKLLDADLEGAIARRGAAVETGLDFDGQCAWRRRSERDGGCCRTRVACLDGVMRYDEATSTGATRDSGPAKFCSARQRRIYPENQR